MNFLWQLRIFNSQEMNIPLNFVCLFYLSGKYGILQEVSRFKSEFE